LSCKMENIPNPGDSRSQNTCAMVTSARRRHLLYVISVITAFKISLVVYHVLYSVLADWGSKDGMECGRNREDFQRQGNWEELPHALRKVSAQGRDLPKCNKTQILLNAIPGIRGRGGQGHPTLKTSRRNPARHLVNLPPDVLHDYCGAVCVALSSTLLAEVCSVLHGSCHRSR
jgi:hypothetical protein